MTRVDVFGNDEERGRHGLTREHVEKTGRGLRVRTVVERQIDGGRAVHSGGRASTDRPWAGIFEQKRKRRRVREREDTETGATTSHHMVTMIYLSTDRPSIS